jgi:Tol biopolymer transport system component
MAAAGLWLQPALAHADRNVSFTTTQGTWMSLDVSPDGKTIVFDLLGDLYTLPITGGTATRITEGRAFDSQPRWAPDGRSIAFASDRSGSDNLWVAGADGANPRAVTSDKDGGITAPAWTADGDYLIARKDPTLNRRGSAELWLYPKSGGAGLVLVKRNAGGGLNPNGPAASRDGRWVYFAHGNRVLDSTWGAWQLWRLDRRSGDVAPLTTGYHGAVRPALSPDGRYVAYVRRNHARSALVLRDVENGAERDLFTDLDRDDQRGTTDYDAYPGFGFTPDGTSIVIASGGHIQRIPLDGGAPAVIPFSAQVSLSLADRPFFPQRIADGPVNARIIRWAGFTSDKRVIFETLGKLWIADASASSSGSGSSSGGGAPVKPTRLTSNTTHREYAPAISPDGKWIAYVTWDDKTGGHVWKMPLPTGTAGASGGASSGSGAQPQQLTTVARQYANPSWSPDGSKIAVSFRPPNYGHTANVWEDDAWHGIVWVPASGGPTHTVTSVRPRNGGRWYPMPRFSTDGTRLFFLAASSETRNDLVSIALDGSDRRAHARFKYVEEAIPSPDGRRLAFVSMDEVYITAMPEGGTGADPLEIDLDRPAVPLRTITRDGGGYLAWADDGKTLTWCYANIAYRLPIGAASESSLKPEQVAIALSVPRALPTGSTLLRGARLLTMKGSEVIEKGDILVTGGRIAAIGKSGSLRVPADAKVVDVSGKTIMPGIVDAHWHGHYQGQEIFPQNKWQYLADLAYGMTTGREVSAPTRDTQAQADLVETGDMIGPRVFGTGWPLFAGREGGPNQVVIVTSLDDARRHVRRLKRNGITWLKQYLQPRREQRQWLQQAALEEGLNITAEGGGLKVQLTMMLDGFTGFEHGIPVVPVYDDVIQLLARSKTTYTPTFVAGYAKPGSMDYYYATQDVHNDPRANRFMPHDLLDRVTGIRVLIPENEYLYRVAARNAYDIIKAGGNVASGGHGNHPGLGPHWEMWSFADGGMPALEALKMGTLTSAEAVGIAQDAGSLEAGKLADLIVLNTDPRANIRKSTDIFRVMKGGTLYDPDALAAKMPPEAKPPVVPGPTPPTAATAGAASAATTPARAGRSGQP